MTIVRQTKTSENMAFAAKNSFHRWNQVNLLLLVLLYFIIPGSYYAVAIPENRSVVNDRGNLPSNRQQPREEYDKSKPSNRGDNSSSDDDNNGIIQVIESEVWDGSENVWKAGTRWTNKKGHVSPSPAEVVAPDGWEFLGDWKIVVSSSNSNSAGMGGSGGGSDPKGWEYQFHYLQPPRRRRIWLRSLTPTKLPPRQPNSGTLPSRIIPKSSRIIPKQPPTTDSSSSRTKVKKIRRTGRFTRTMQIIRDDWNYKGLGFNLFKSFIWPTSIGVAIRLPLSINFDTFDRNPAWPIISSSAAVFYPPMMGGFLSTSVHVEWVKWMTKCMLGLIPRSIFWISYRLVLPVLWAIASAMLLPFKGIVTLPPRPTKIPNGSWWTGRKIDKPQYNSEMSERIGCSVSYRWSRRRGYEFRISYWHSYLPTMLVYQQFLSQLQERLKGSIPSGSSSSSSSPISLSSSSSASLLSDTGIKAKTNWWRKHTASLGVSTSGPIPDTPPIACSANLSLSGLYFGARQVMSRKSITPSTIPSTAGSKTSGVVPAIGGSNDNTSTEPNQDYEDRATASTLVRTASIKKGSSLS
jgi:hypothetical protein